MSCRHDVPDSHPVCICGSSDGLKTSCLVAIVLNSVDIVGVIGLIILSKMSNWTPPLWLKIVVLILISAIALLALIVGEITVATNNNCRNCKSTCDIPRCDRLYKMGTANIVLFFIDEVVIVLLIRQGIRKQQNDGVKDGASDLEMTNQQTKTSVWIQYWIKCK